MSLEREYKLDVTFSESVFETMAAPLSADINSTSFPVCKKSPLSVHDRGEVAIGHLYEVGVALSESVLKHYVHCSLADM